MNRQNVLVVSGNNELAEWTKLPHPFHVVTVSNDEQAIESSHLQIFDLIVVDTTDVAIDSRKLKAVLPILQDEATLLFYEGESVDKLSENIDAVFNAKKYKRVLNMLMLEPAVNKIEMPQFSLN